VSDAALICDTGALVDYLVAGAPDHDAYRRVIDAARARYIPGMVLAEVDYFLRHHRDAMRALVADILRGAFIYAPPTEGQLARSMVLDQQYGHLQLGLVDCTIIALAEELDIVRLATRDVRDFTQVALGDGRSFELVVLPATPPPPPPRRTRRRRR
jgi:predicted nucleic acid-binding protein